MIIKRFLLFILVSFIVAGTDGTIRGRILNFKGEPLPGAQVFIQDLGIGAIADLEGNYILLNIQAGQYDVTVAMIGYATQIMQDVDIVIDQAVWLNFELKVEAVEGEKVIVSGEKALVERGSTSKKITVSKEAIEALPIRDMGDLFSLQSGVVKVEGGMQGGIPDHEEKGLEEVHVRGGRAGEIAYMIDGLYIRNPIFGGVGNSTRLNLFAIKHWDWQPGGFNAEYGDAMSAVSNSHTNKGGKSFEYKFQYSTSLVGAALGSEYDELRGYNDYSLGFGGPVPVLNNFIDENLFNMTYWLSGQSTSEDNRTVLEFDDYFHQSGDPGNNNNRNKVTRVDDDGNMISVGVQPWDNTAGFRGFGYENTDDMFANVSFNLFNNKLRLNTTYWKVKAKQKIFSTTFLYWDEGQNELFRDTDRLTFELNHSLSQRTFYTIRGSRFQQESFLGVRWRDSDSDGYPDWFEWSNPAGSRENPTSGNKISDPYNPDVVPYTYNDDGTKVYYTKRDGSGPDQWTSGWYQGAPVPGNYKWDVVEDWDDDNLNGIWDPGESFVDSDQSGSWNGPVLIQQCEFRDGDYWLTPEMYVNHELFLDQEVYWNEIMQSPATENSGYLDYFTYGDSLYFVDFPRFENKWSEGRAFGGHDRFYSTSDAITQELRFDITSQLTDKWKTRAGVDYKTHKLDFIEVANPWDDVSARRQRFSEQWDDWGADGIEYLDSDSGLPDQGEGNGVWDPGESFDDFNRDGEWNSYVEPAEFSVYIQNTFEVPWMVVNAGIRADAVNFNTKIWADPDGNFSPERPWFWSDCGLDGLCPGEVNYNSKWTEGGADYGTYDDDGVKISDVFDGKGDPDIGENDQTYNSSGNGYWNYGEYYEDSLDEICGEGDDYFDSNNNGFCDTDASSTEYGKTINGDILLNDLAGNRQWDWEDTNGNGVCDEGECEPFVDQGEETGDIFGMANEQVFFRNSEWFWKFSPRLGFSHIISDQATFTFNYGVYYQTPTYDNIYLNTNRQEDPSTLFEESVGEIGNATMTAARSQAYEVAFNFQVGPQWGVTVGAWLKDMDQMTTAKTYRSGIYEYQVSSNGDYGTAKGLDLTVRNSGMFFTTVLQYTYSIARANGAYAKSAFGGVYVDAPSQTYLMPFDRPHDLTLSLYTALPYGIMTSFTGFYQSGVPYTPQEMVGSKPYTDELKKNSRRSNPYKNINMSFSKYLDYKDFKISLGLNIFNLFDIRNPYSVYELTGVPDDPGEYYMDDVKNQSEDGSKSGSYFDTPWRYSPPREINFFIKFEFN